MHGSVSLRKPSKGYEIIACQSVCVHLIIYDWLLFAIKFYSLCDKCKCVVAYKDKEACLLSNTSALMIL